MSVLIGSARISENNTVRGKAGDQKQTTVPDMNGEVSMQPFYVHKLGWYVLRPKLAILAAYFAQGMYDLCNNKNGGYNQDDRYGVIRLGTKSTIPFNMDCGTAVRAIVREKSGIDPGEFYTATELEVLMNTGLFDLYEYKNGFGLCTGDILVTKSRGHTCIVVSGVNRPISDGESTRVASTHKNPYKEPTSTLGRNAKGECVKWIQYELTEAGYDLSKAGGIDGDFGKVTEAAVKDFQRTHGLTVDGIVGKYTRNALKRDKPAEPQEVKPSTDHTFGIDVARWQGTIDWAKVKADGKQFAVLKVTKKNNKTEESFEMNYYGTKSVGMPIAVYRYVYAKTVGEAMREADGIIKALEGKTIEGEIWLDMEDASIRDIGKANLTKVINTEASILKGAGYKVGIYCNRTWYEKVLDGAELSKTYLFWIAKYGKNAGNGSWKNRTDDPKDIAYAWQYTSKGQVNGIKGYVDLDLIY